MTKWNPLSSVRRPESGTMAECGDGDSSKGRPYRDPLTHSWTLGSSMRRRYRGPWQITGLAAAWGARNLPGTL
ncbi:unnamed protein product [Staurois parvus]|uniref:Uncharacterized protein n=1 Tax=Staurois parvus TaxID=386267 RepID=A0ABN9HIK6_9NEOB|nr:unnamed protein product [Staurois parvus]